MSTKSTSETTMIAASSSRRMLLLLMISITIIAPVSSFAVPPPQTTTFSQSITASTIQCRMSPPSSSTTPEAAAIPEESAKETKTKTTPAKNEEIMKQLERAKAAIAVSRVKIEAQEAFVAFIREADDKQDASKEKENVPFFATANDSDNNSSTNSNGKKEKVIKDKNEDTGSFTTDGELMAKLSEEEEWESRPILEVFETEEQEGEKKSFNAKNVDRDIAKSMFNLRKSLQTEDFMKIFDKRNIFIGDP
jgi:hypothetical protein